MKTLRGVVLKKHYWVTPMALKTLNFRRTAARVCARVRVSSLKTYVHAVTVKSVF